MSIDRRAQYRVDLGEATDLAVTIPNPQGSPFSGRLLDVSGSGAGVRFALPDCPILALGEVVELVFTSKRLKDPVRVTASVQNRTEEEGTRRYGFGFLEGEQLDAELPSVLRKLFNRRKALRVSPDPGMPVAVVLEGEGGGMRVEARLANLSPIGAGVTLDPESESAFANTSRLGISPSLPDSRVPGRLIAHIRHRRLIAAEILYGLEFDPDLSQDFTRQQNQITKYVMERQRALLRTEARKRR